MIPPGQAGSIRAEVDTSHLRGRVGRGITVTTNDPVNPSTRLTVWVDVLTSVQILPAEKLALGNRAGASQAGRLLLRRDPGEPNPLNVTGARGSEPWLAVEARRLDAPSLVQGELPSGQPGDWILEVRATGDVPPGSHRAEVTFDTGGKNQPTATVPVLVHWARPVNVSDERIVLSSDGEERQVFFTVRPDLDPGILQVEAEPDAVRTRLESTGPRHFRLSVGWDPAAGQSPRGRVTLRVGDEQVELPVVGLDP